ncbi:NAD(P)(+) transhydrogenase (Re/Si-specific) subunit beta [Paraburkholderia dilworthii]|uniref:NAD(P)(+) transhydrogenase (Re/Si-specific) subunit beta n=1 Tax=Paraburkholderia dilworthii TaxID=948106 RepID=UPI000481FC53|nr:NAD(P)(+) transhydrogenase (Re/Si-specific) subunit beta [Paraburkholderia dilworthii]
MSQASDSTVWLGMFVPLKTAFAALLACALGSVLVAAAGAVAGARFARRRNLARGPALAALLASGVGLSIASIGVARYLSALSSRPSMTEAFLERIELCTAVFAGALIFATSAIAFCKLRGVLPLRAAARPGHRIVNGIALLLCGWLGYGFVTEAAQPFGLAALLAMSALSSSLGVHVMLCRECSKGHVHGRRIGIAMGWRDETEMGDALGDAREIGMVRAAAYRHRGRWHNSGSGQRQVRARSTRRLSSRSAVIRQPGGRSR